MKLLFYSDYINNSRGGGERHLLLVALAAAKQHFVTVALPNVSPVDAVDTIRELSLLVGSSLEALEFITIDRDSMNKLQWIKWLRQYEGVFWVSDGSIPMPITRHRYLHFQIPFAKKLSINDKIKLRFWLSSANCNSLFTKQSLEQHWGANIPTVLWPLVDVPTNTTPTMDRPKQIISIGRFYRQLHAKRQDILIEAFSQLRKTSSRFAQYRLILVGGVEDEVYLMELKTQAKGLPVEFYHEISRKQLIKTLGSSRYYWHAAGYQVDEQINPENVEHFGMSVAESMASGCIPLVVAKGGCREVLGEDLAKECDWQNIPQLIERMQHFENKQDACQSVQNLALNQVRQFGLSAFEQRVTQYFQT